MTIRATVRTSAGLARDRLRQAPRRLLAVWLLQSVVLFVVASLLPGVLVSNLVSALLAVAVIAGLNALVRPVIVLLTLPLTVATFGLVSLLINTIVIVLASPLVPASRPRRRPLRAPGDRARLGWWDRGWRSTGS